MLRENIMNGRLPEPNDAPYIGTGFGAARMEEIFTPTLAELKVTEESFEDYCVLSWDKCIDANRYRVDVYRVTDLGPTMGCLNYTAVQTEYTDKVTIKTCKLEKMNTYRAVVFAYNNDEFVGRYSPVFCVASPKIVGDMLSDTGEDFSPVYKDINNDFSLEYETLSAEKSVLLNENPDRGFRAEEDFFLPSEDKIPDWTDESVLEDVKRRVAKSVYGEKVTVSRVYMILDKYIENPVLPQKLLDYMEAIWNAYRTLGVRMYLCHYYQHGMDIECVTQDIVLKHLKQLKPLFERNKDAIFAMNFSFIGSYGEWTAIRKDLDRQVFVNAFMDAAPDDIRLIIRQPLYKHAFINRDFWRYNRIGFADDACHGLMLPHIDLGQSYWQPGSQWWEIGVKEAPYTINDAETFTTRWIRLSGTWPTGHSCMQSLSQKHTTTLSIQHAYGDIWQFGGTIEQTCMYGWKSEEVTKELIEEYGLAVSDGWFKDKNGNTVKRNAFEYIRDYIGYRISADSIDVKQDGDELNLTLNLKNYGYGAGFNLQSSFAVIDSNGEVVSEVSAGNPEEWYGTNPKDYSDRKLLQHKISAQIPLPCKSGKYKLVFILRNGMGQCARMDNAVKYENGKHILFEFDI